MTQGDVVGEIVVEALEATEKRETLNVRRLKLPMVLLTILLLHIHASPHSARHSIALQSCFASLSLSF